MPLILVSTRLSDRISETPEGYLLCEGVALARTGDLEYLPEEVPVTPGDGDMILIERGEADLFDKATMASFEGRPLTDGHPSDDVTPATWKKLARGVVQNVRRGTGPEADLLLADLLVTDADAIKAVNGGLRELSCGYDADYIEIAPGRGRQTHLRGNHVALVSEGRCGPRCAIRDWRTKTRDHHMKTKKPGLLATLLGSAGVRKAMDADPRVKKALDEALVEGQAGDEDPEEKPVPATDEGEPDLAEDMAEIKMLLRSLVEKMGATGDEDPEVMTDEDPEDTQDEDPEDVQDEDPEVTKDRKPRKTGDWATATLVRDAAILSPGMIASTGDRASVVKRVALRAAMKDGAVARAVKAIARDGIDRATGPTLDAAFSAAVEIKRSATNGRTADALTRGDAKGRDAGAYDTPASLNAKFAEYRKNMKG
ncbi:DUF2213 domain-containing protein [Rhodospirillum sp. A1_3_36]|uniref:DUF2213 domain-containing protein n=1 Tax=Rhodospirillum sp. A1_3_36 TaxID=3391666 RepID=UPI0039A60525